MRSLLHKGMMKAWAISREGYKEVIQRLLVFVRMQKESYDSRINWLCRRKQHSRRRFCMKFILRGTLFTWVASRCIMTYGSNSGRQWWSMKQLVMCQNVILVRRSRLVIWNLEVCCNLWVFRIESGMTLVWISLWDCFWLPASIIWFGWLWIDSQSLLTSYLWTPTITSRSMLKSTLLACYACTKFQRWSFLIEGHSLSLAFRSNCMRPSKLTWFTVWPITHRRMAKLSE
jgi:hypothetical protein